MTEFLSQFQASLADREDSVRQLIWQTERLLGNLDMTPCVIEGDDDRSILEHNFRCIVNGLVSRTISEAQKYAAR